MMTLSGFDEKLFAISRIMHKIEASLQKGI